jgi:hypothetical protein
MTWRPPVTVREPPPELNQDMTPSDIVFELAQLQFDHREFRRISLDRNVRDWLLTRLTARRA